MANKKLNKTIIHGMNYLQRAFLEVHPNTDRFIYKITADDIFDLTEIGPIISKDSYKELYESWSDTELEQITGLLLLIHNDINVETHLGEDKKGEYGDFSVENDTEKYIVRVYAPRDFVMAMSIHFLKNIVYVPAFTIQELYKQSLNAD
jgi:hypothetical protein